MTSRPIEPRIAALADAFMAFEAAHPEGRRSDLFRQWVVTLRLEDRPAVARVLSCRWANDEKPGKLLAALIALSPGPVIEEETQS